MKASMLVRTLSNHYQPLAVDKVVCAPPPSRKPEQMPLVSLAGQPPCDGQSALCSEDRNS